MAPTNSKRTRPVTVPDQADELADRAAVALARGITRRDTAARDVLVAQWPARVATAIVVAAFQWASPAWDAPLPHRDALLVITVAYVALVTLLRGVLRSRERAGHLLVSSTLAADVALLFGVAWASLQPDRYERALVGMLLIVHVATYRQGTRQAWRALAAGMLGYLLLIGSQIDAHVGMTSLAPLLIASGVAALLIVQAGDVRRRLRDLVSLFERAEAGDFSGEYDVLRDRRPDAITRVGRAYNGVRTQLANMVLTDPLTGCLNRRGFDQALSREMARATRAHGEIALLALDLDHFKRVNDTWGHLAGDVVLRNVGALLLRAARTTDVVARVGGEEFAVLLPETGSEGARVFAERLCEMVRGQPFLIGAQAVPVPITMSIGAATETQTAADGASERLWQRADSALYAAKRDGRDCLREWCDTMVTTGEHPAPSQSARQEN